MSDVAVAFQGVWSGDAEEEHRHGGRRLPGDAHHRVEGALLRFGRPHQGDARHSESVFKRRCQQVDNTPKGYHRIFDNLSSQPA